MQRTEWVDRAKGLGIILVVLGHSTQYLYDDKFAAGLTSVIYTFHMPLFFLLSGIFSERSFEKHGPATFLEEKISGIAYPYFLYSLVEGGYRYVLGRTTGFSDFLGLRRIAEIPYAPIYHFWFLYTLFLCFLTFCVFRMIARRSLSVVLLMAFAIFIIGLAGQLPPGPIRQYADSLFFFAAGIYLGRAMHGQFSGSQIHEFLAAATCLFLLFNLGPFFPQEFDAKRAFTTIFLAASGISLFIFSAMWMSNETSVGRGFFHLGRNSLPIFIFHIPPIAITKYFLDTHGYKGSWIHVPIEVALGLSLPLALVRYALPRFPGLLKMNWRVKPMQDHRPHTP